MLALTGTTVNVHRVRRAPRLRRRGRSGSSSSRSSACRCSSGPSSSSSCSGDRLLPVRTAAHDLRPTSAATRGPSSTSTALAHRTRSTRRCFDRETGLAEVIIPPRSPFIGEIGLPGHGDRAAATSSWLAIQRKGEDARGPGRVELAVGDALLLAGPWEALDAQRRRPGRARRRPSGARPPPGRAARAARAGGDRRPGRDGRRCSSTGLVPPAVAGLLAAGALVVLPASSPSSGPTGRSRGRRSSSSRRCSRSRPRCSKTGAADLVAEALVDVVGGARPVRAAGRACSS